MVCESQRKCIYLFLILSVTLVPAIYVLAHSRMPIDVDILTGENAKFEVSGNADFLIFWGVLFFTCIVGIIELLQLVEKKNNNWMNVFYFIVYWGLLFGIIFSLSRSWVIMRENYAITISGGLGDDYKQYIADNWSILDNEFIRSTCFEAFIMISSILVFDLIFWGKNWLSPKRSTSDS